MDVSDVPGPTHTSTHKSTGCTLHIIEGDAFIGITPQAVIVESGSPVRIADEDWPPAMLFDAVYASLALKTFGVKTSIESMKGVWKDELSFGLTLGTPSERQRAIREDQRVCDASKTKLQDAAHAQRRATRDGYKDDVELDSLDFLFLVPYLAASPQQVHEVWAADQRKQEMDAQRESEARVHEWRRTTVT